MKICYLANARSIHTQRWARHFSDRGYDVTVLSFCEGDINDVPVISIYSETVSSRFKILLKIGEIRNLIKRINPDILHAHYATSYGLVGAIAGKHPFVVTAWGTDVLVMPEKSWIYRQIVNFVLKRADMITSMAPHMTDLLTRRGYAKVDKIVDLPFGVDTNIFNLKKRIRPSGDQPAIIVSTRRPDYGMDVDTFVRAIPSVLKHFKEAQFIMTGDGPLRKHIEILAHDLGVAGHIVFRGEIPHLEMPELLSRADVFVSTSLTDGNNISLNEAMACGAFPVATDISANRAWIRNGYNGLLYKCQDYEDLANAIVLALHQPKLRDSATKENWEIVQTRASWVDSMITMEHHYKRLVEQRDYENS